MSYGQHTALSIETWAGKLTGGAEETLGGNKEAAMRLKEYSLRPISLINSLILSVLPLIF
jgi:hypothetical protein